MPMPTKEAQNAYQREWLQRRRLAWLEANGGACVKCGSTEDLEVDHIDRNQKVSHRVWSWSEARREAELAKCQILCNDCHKAKTQSELLAPHGTHTRYVHGCHCDECRAAHAALAREWRAAGKKW